MLEELMRSHDPFLSMLLLEDLPIRLSAPCIVPLVHFFQGIL